LKHKGLFYQFDNELCKTIDKKMFSQELKQGLLFIYEKSADDNKDHKYFLQRKAGTTVGKNKRVLGKRTPNGSNADLKALRKD